MARERPWSNIQLPSFSELAARTEETLEKYQDDKVCPFLLSYMSYLVENFRAGQVATRLDVWKSLTADPEILRI